MDEYQLSELLQVARARQPAGREGSLKRPRFNFFIERLGFALESGHDALVGHIRVR